MFQQTVIAVLHVGDRRRRGQKPVHGRPDRSKMPLPEPPASSDSDATASDEEQAQQKSLGFHQDRSHVLEGSLIDIDSEVVPLVGGVTRPAVAATVSNVELLKDIQYVPSPVTQDENSQLSHSDTYTDMEPNVAMEMETSEHMTTDKNKGDGVDFVQKEMAKIPAKSSHAGKAQQRSRVIPHASESAESDSENRSKVKDESSEARSKATRSKFSRSNSMPRGGAHFTRSHRRGDSDSSTDNSSKLRQATDFSTESVEF